MTAAAAGAATVS